ncbi:hypothetical protein PQE75_gp049 [Bacillus phage vB_BcoS-136]|uniref:Uncharacterized protein n=1 Tax=Bacillus phage vB_BcoS-136 TaxID=2419619 RepID=A0A3G3BVK3_9CAUD|nr:hypothetical protein PQE75_gp049 [Bacillus phage vB_BcoS-136]AYP68181.1 hypothetical protein vBBcoS136_00049 [Bacillus phage vB_BcoS-136]
MNNEIALKILDILESLDNRITQVEQSLENIQVDNHYFMSWGSDKQAIDEIKKLITG